MLGALAKNRTAEQDIRVWLNARGYHGNSAVITDIELHAVGRPGWIQVFRFKAKVKSESTPPDQPWADVFGAVRDDERSRGKLKTQVEIFSTQQQQLEKLAIWSEDLIVRDAPNSHALAVLLVGGTVLLSLAVAISQWMGL